MIVDLQSRIAVQYQRSIPPTTMPEKACWWGLFLFKLLRMFGYAQILLVPPNTPKQKSPPWQVRLFVWRGVVVEVVTYFMDNQSRS